MSEVNNNPAASLHSVLESLRGAGAATLDQGWKSVLGVSTSSVEFTRRHAEVVSLFQRVVGRIEAMPEGNASRARYERYLTPWYAAVVPRRQWASSQAPCSDSLSQADLDQLAAFGDWLAVRESDEPGIDSEDLVLTMRDALSEWRELLSEATLPGSLRGQLAAQISHLDWLLANIGTFGSQPVVDRSHELIGTGVSALGLVPRLGKKIGQALVAITGAVAIMAGTVHGGNELLRELQVMSQTIADIATADDNKPQIARVPALKELPAGESQ